MWLARESLPAPAILARADIHWDLVCLQDAAHGGGEIWFDGQLLRKDGLFVVDEVRAPNPENLK